MPAYVVLISIFLALVAPSPTCAQIKFQFQQLTLDANEGIAAGDINGDGVTDIVAGRNWYQGPNWTPRPLRNIEDWNGYVQSNGDFLFDVNDDGLLDVIAGSFLPTEVHWYQNPGAESLKLGQLWPKRLLVDTKNSSNEGQIMQDLDGDGLPEWIVNSWQKDVPAVIWRLTKKTDLKKLGPDEAKFEMKPHQIGERGNGHGLGVGDINGDGRLDVLMGQGWYEQPAADPWDTPWRFHRDWDIQASLPIIVTDLDGDNRNDLIVGYGHNFGLYWWKNEGLTKEGTVKWTPREIDKQYSQPHTLAWEDLDNDGQPELITGKRYRAHNGGDPGGAQPPCLYYYKWDREKLSFERHTIEEGHVGCGLQIVVEDLNGDGQVDIAVAGKSGTFVLTASKTR